MHLKQPLRKDDEHEKADCIIACVCHGLGYEGL